MVNLVILITLFSVTDHETTIIKETRIYKYDIEDYEYDWHKVKKDLAKLDSSNFHK